MSIKNALIYHICKCWHFSYLNSEVSEENRVRGQHSTKPPKSQRGTNLEGSERSMISKPFGGGLIYKPLGGGMIYKPLGRGLISKPLGGGLISKPLASWRRTDLKASWRRSDLGSSWKRTDLEAPRRRTEDLSGICARSLSPFDGGGAPTLFSHQFLRTLLHPPTNPSSALTTPQTLHFEQSSRSALYKELLGPVWPSLAQSGTVT